jgi:hypothetical protein
VKAHAHGDGGIGFVPQDRRGRLTRHESLRGVNDAQSVGRKSSVFTELRFKHIGVPDEDDIEVRFRISQSVDGARHLDCRSRICTHGIEGNPHVDRSRLV